MSLRSTRGAFIICSLFFFFGLLYTFNQYKIYMPFASLQDKKKNLTLKDRYRNLASKIKAPFNTLYDFEYLPELKYVSPDLRLKMISDESRSPEAKKLALNMRPKHLIKNQKLIQLSLEKAKKNPEALKIKNSKKQLLKTSLPSLFVISNKEIHSFPPEDILETRKFYTIVRFGPSSENLDTWKVFYDHSSKQLDVFIGLLEVKTSSQFDLNTFIERNPDLYVTKTNFDERRHLFKVSHYFNLDFDYRKIKEDPTVTSLKLIFDR